MNVFELYSFHERETEKQLPHVLSSASPAYSKRSPFFFSFFFFNSFVCGKDHRLVACFGFNQTGGTQH